MNLLEAPDWIIDLIKTGLTAAVTFLFTRRKAKKDEVIEHASAITQQWEKINGELDRRLQTCYAEINELREKLSAMMDRVEELEEENRTLKREKITKNLKPKE